MSFFGRSGAAGALPTKFAAEVAAGIANGTVEDLAVDAARYSANTSPFGGRLGLSYRFGGAGVVQGVDESSQTGFALSYAALDDSTPVVRSVSSSDDGTVRPGDSITIRGARFNAADGEHLIVTVGGSACRNPVVGDSGNSITCEVTPIAAGRYGVYVAVAGRIATVVPGVSVQVTGQVMPVQKAALGGSIGGGVHVWVRGEALPNQDANYNSNDADDYSMEVCGVPCRPVRSREISVIEAAANTSISLQSEVQAGTALVCSILPSVDIARPAETEVEVELPLISGAYADITEQPRVSSSALRVHGDTLDLEHASNALFSFRSTIAADAETLASMRSADSSSDSVVLPAGVIPRGATITEAYIEVSAAQGIGADGDLKFEIGTVMPACAGAEAGGLCELHNGAIADVANSSYAYFGESPATWVFDRFKAGG